MILIYSLNLPDRIDRTGIPGITPGLTPRTNLGKVVFGLIVVSYIYNSHTQLGFINLYKTAELHHKNVSYTFLEGGNPGGGPGGILFPKIFGGRPLGGPGGIFFSIPCGLSPGNGIS